jgi:hypothetical protein
VKLSDLAKVQALAGERELLIERRDGEVGISVNGWDMSAEFVTMVAPTIKLEFRHRIDDIDQKLRRLGVEIC